MSTFNIRIAALLLAAAVALSAALSSCSDAGNNDATLPSSVTLAENGATAYVICRPDIPSDAIVEASKALKKAINAQYGVEIAMSSDWLNERGGEIAPEFEILIGATARTESETGELAYNEAYIGMNNGKLVIRGADDYVTAAAVEYFITNYVTGDSLTVPAELNEKITIEMDYSKEADMTYAEMAASTMDSFITAYYKNGWARGSAFWDTAEILEALIDAAEQTGSAKYLEYAESTAAKFEGDYTKMWISNEYNDDIMWITIAYMRLYKLTGKENYLTTAKKNFDATHKRAADDVLGGGWWWRTDKQCKNACINGPAAIAACLIGEATQDETYFDIAKEAIAWELDTLWKSNGKIFDCIDINKKLNTWSSTYNQGTFIGACTLLYNHTGDESYLENARLAAYYAKDDMYNGGVMNNEDSGGDLIGFKGILTRWLYRYAKQVEDSELLGWLRLNADAAWSNRNADGLIWTTWDTKTPDDVKGYATFGMSCAVALMFNCQDWR